jgi:hypothetical protein
MREVNFVRDTVNGMAHLLNVDPEQDVMRDHARAWVSSINAMVRYGWGFWPWPELEITEERAFRQVWYTDVDYTAGQGENSEVYYPPNQKYYRATRNPPVGTLPTNATYFEEITAALLDRHLAYEQYGKQDIDRVISIDNANPRTDRTALGWVLSPSSIGIDVPCTAGPTIWVTYIPRPPEFTSTTYDPTRSYRRGDLALSIEDDETYGHCYRTLTGGVGKGLDLGSYWLRQQMPYVIAEYVKYGASAEHAGDAQTKAGFQATAQNRLYDEVDKLLGQGQRFRYKTAGAWRPVCRPYGCSALQA